MTAEPIQTDEAAVRKAYLRRLTLLGGQIRAAQTRLQTLLDERDDLTELLEEMGVSKARCARAAGVTPEALYQYTRRRVRRSS